MANQNTDEGYRDPIEELEHPKQRIMLRVFQDCFNITTATRAAGIHRSLHYKWRDSDSAYARAFDQVRRQASDILESELMERVFKGVPKLVMNGGKPVFDKNGDPLYEYVKDPATLIFALKAAMPDKYRDKFQAPTGDDDGVRIAGRSRAEVIAEEIQARQKALEMIQQSESARGN